MHSPLTWYTDTSHCVCDCTQRNALSKSTIMEKKICMLSKSRLENINHSFWYLRFPLPHSSGIVSETVKIKTLHFVV